MTSSMVRRTMRAASVQSPLPELKAKFASEGIAEYWLPKYDSMTFAEVCGDIECRGVEMGEKGDTDNPFFRVARNYF